MLLYSIHTLANLALKETVPLPPWTSPHTTDYDSGSHDIDSVLKSVVDTCKYHKITKIAQIGNIAKIAMITVQKIVLF